MKTEIIEREEEPRDHERTTKNQGLKTMEKKYKKLKGNIE